ncbi:hypothetical protein HGRIS_006747 [Hohenbuehelia grisea]|uniref:DUF5648 domain-containing protein n=1 Tax=Hohenbuehelia grisea TaxID=104357 RepID=A0ABR3JAI0_9AGAR
MKLSTASIIAALCLVQLAVAEPDRRPYRGDGDDECPAPITRTVTDRATETVKVKHTVRVTHTIKQVVTQQVTVTAQKSCPTPPTIDPCSEAKKYLVPFYRSWNGGNTDHFYTTDEAEWNRAVGGGWVKEGTAGKIFSKQVKGSVPLYRSWNGANADHFYTTNEQEWNNAVGGGWAKEGIAGYVYPVQQCGSIPLYRTWQGSAGGQNKYPDRVYKTPGPPTADHFYTISAPERDNAVANLNYVNEGVAGFVFP